MACVMRGQADKARTSPGAIAIADGGSRCLKRHATCSRLHDQAAKCLNTQVTKLIIHQRSQA